MEWAPRLVELERCTTPEMPLVRLQLDVARDRYGVQVQYGDETMLQTLLQCLNAGVEPARWTATEVRQVSNALGQRVLWSSTLDWKSR